MRSVTQGGGFRRLWMPLTRDRWGYAIAAGRLGWLVVAVISISLFVIAIPYRYDQFHHLPVEGSSHPLTERGVIEAGLTVTTFAKLLTTGEAILAFGFIAVAIVIARQKFTDPVVLTISLMLILFGTTFPRTLGALVDAEGWLAVPVDLLGLLGFVTFFICFYIFPDGRFVPGWTRWLVPLWVLEEAVYFFPKGPVWVEPVFFFLFLGLVGSSIYAQIHRYRHWSSPEQRQQSKWVILGFSLAVTGFLTYGLTGTLVESERAVILHELIGGGLMVLCFLAVPAAIGVAITHYRLWEIDLVINRLLVYGVLSTAVVAIYILIVGYLSLLVQSSGHLVFSLIATGVVAVLFQPMRERLQHAVNRLLYGDRDDPYAVLTGLGRRLETTLAPEAIMPAIVETVAHGLKSPYVAIDLWQDNQLVPVAGFGDADRQTIALPLTYQSIPVGQLRVAPRGSGEAFGQSDLNLIEGIAGQAGVAAHALKLTTDLQRSRERLVMAREEERRRIRRDLHDGLGPSLASMTLQIDAIRLSLPPDLPASDRLDALRGQVEAAISDIRRLAYDLRPPALDELGLVAALNQHAARLTTNTLRVTIEAKDIPSDLPAAVEVAAYRIIVEALTNITRHAGARHANVRLWDDGALQIAVSDDGNGIPTGAHMGVGLLSMRERAVELGGSCTITSDSQGTELRATLPVPGVADRQKADE